MKDKLDALIEKAKAIIQEGNKDSPKVQLVKDSLWEVEYSLKRLLEHGEKLEFLTGIKTHLNETGKIDSK